MNTLIFVPELKKPFNSPIWHSPEIIKDVNCLAFSLGEPQMGTARPGKLMDLKNEELGTLVTVKNVQEYLNIDGFWEITEQEAISGKVHSFAIRVRERFDFHAYGFENFSWFEKPAEQAPRPLFNAVSPARIKNSIYNKIVGFYKVPETGIPYLKRLDINT